jgi:hypothetical protein
MPSPDRTPVGVPQLMAGPYRGALRQRNGLIHEDVHGRARPRALTVGTPQASRGSHPAFADRHGRRRRDHRAGCTRRRSVRRAGVDRLRPKARAIRSATTPNSTNGEGRPGSYRLRAAPRPRRYARDRELDHGPSVLAVGPHRSTHPRAHHSPRHHRSGHRSGQRAPPCSVALDPRPAHCCVAVSAPPR